MKGTYEISTDSARFDLDLIHEFLTTTYWAQGRPREVVERSIRNSLCFGAFDGAHQVGFARVITDRAVFGYLADVFVLEEYRGRGLSKWLMEVILGHPELQGFRRWLLATRGAHGLYQKFGFDRLAHPENMMEIVRAGMYVTGGR